MFIKATNEAVVRYIQADPEEGRVRPALVHRGNSNV